MEQGTIIKTTAEKVRVLCVLTGSNCSELARRTGQTPQNLNAKLKRGRLSVAELEEYAEAMGAKFCYYFELPDGNRI